MPFQPLLIDLILALIIGLSVYFSARRGFVRTFVEAVGLITAAVLAFTICTPLANVTYDKIIEPPVLKMVSNELDANFKETLHEIPDFIADEKEINEFKNQINISVEKIAKALPHFVQKHIEKTGIDADTILKNAVDIADEDDTAGKTAEKLAKSISQNKFKPIAVQILSYVYSFVVFALALLVVKILARVLNKAFSFSIAGKLNTALGGACGLVKGVAFAFGLCLLIYVIISFTQNGIWIFSVENIDKTFIFKYLISLIKI